MLLQVEDSQNKLRSLYRTTEVLNDVQISRNPGHYLVENNDQSISTIRVKSIFSNDSEKSLRSSFLSEIFRQEQISEFDIKLDTIPRPYEEYDIFVMSSNDTNRIARFMKANLALCNSVPKICVTNKMHPTKRAKLLKAGFDDVVDISQTNDKEMKSRILAIQSRYTSARASLLLTKQFETLLSEVVDLKKITASQKRVLVKILSHSGRVCPVFSLQMAGSLGTEPISLEHLRVLIHHVRSAMHEPFDITNISGVGYCVTLKSGKDAPVHVAGT